MGQNMEQGDAGFTGREASRLEASRIEGLLHPDDNNSLRELSEIFGNKAEIKRVKEGGFVIETTLEDGIASGGQKIIIELTDIKSVAKLRTRKEVRACQVQRLVINGVALESEFPEIFFEVRPEERRAFKENSTLSQTELRDRAQQEDNTLLKHILMVYGTSTALGSKSIFLTVFSNADDLIALFHEAGHISDPESSSSRYPGIAFLHALEKVILKRSGVIQKNRIATIRNWKYIVEREVVANINGLMKIGKLKEKVDLFSQDPHLLREKKSLEQKTISYLREANSWFSRQVSPALISKMMNLEFGNIDTEED